MKPKRHSTQLRLESIEARLLPGVVALHALAARTAAADVARLHMRADHVKTTRTPKSDARLQHRHVPDHAVSTQAAQPAPHHQTHPQQPTSAISSFFQSILKGL